MSAPFNLNRPFGDSTFHNSHISPLQALAGLFDSLVPPSSVLITALPPTFGKAGCVLRLNSCGVDPLLVASVFRCDYVFFVLPIFAC